jgi:hypothetical protein
VSHPIPTEVRPRKYRNVPTVVEGIRFASKAEAKRYVELRWLEKAGEVSSLELQKRYPLVGADGIKVAVYVADFDYLNPDGEPVTEDVKSPTTANLRLFRMKAKLFKAQYGREITVVRTR